jgi:hypothetical protein
MMLSLDISMYKETKHQTKHEEKNAYPKFYIDHLAQDLRWQIKQRHVLVKLLICRRLELGRKHLMVSSKTIKIDCF